MFLRQVELILRLSIMISFNTITQSEIESLLGSHYSPNSQYCHCITLISADTAAINKIKRQGLEFNIAGNVALPLGDAEVSRLMPWSKTIGSEMWALNVQKSTFGKKSMFPALWEGVMNEVWQKFTPHQAPHTIERPSFDLTEMVVCGVGSR